ncbi:hypothetical protein XAPC_821 [Xanthomonas citri pv. punicae str. LMG 859]|nr:hypothetical protein XAPC_821 [Xanthomonas citri pv. punicae str. LMG 859]
MRHAPGPAARPMLQDLRFLQNGVRHDFAALQLAQTVLRIGMHRLDSTIAARRSRLLAPL